MKNTHRILFVDDDPNFLEGIRRMLHTQRASWDLFFAHTADEAIEKTEHYDFDAIVADISMPGKDGFQLLGTLVHSNATRDVPVVIITGMNDTTVKRRALEEGATDLLGKPVSMEELLARLRSVLRLKDYQDELKRQNEVLEVKVRERTADLEESRLDIMLRLGKVAEFRDAETGNHILRVGCFCRAIAQELGMDLDFVERLFLTAPLHDIGKIGISDDILLKPGKLNDAERDIMKRHTLLGAQMLLHEPKGLRPFLQWHRDREAVQRSSQVMILMAADIALYHHERWDGGGYPKGLSGTDIPLSARITALADVYDALRSKRPYKEPFSQEDTIEIITAQSGKQFDPMIVAAFASVTDVFDDMYHEFSDEILNDNYCGANDSPIWSDLDKLRANVTSEH